METDMSGNTLNISERARALSALDEELGKLQNEIAVIDDMIAHLQKKREGLAKQLRVFSAVSDSLIGV
jgi:predicted  nucleic acid-binding Zn-ribbon protein